MSARVTGRSIRTLRGIPHGAGAPGRAPPRRYTPEALTPEGGFVTYDAPRFPGDMPGRWFGFHYHDYSVDTFH